MISTIILTWLCIGFVFGIYRVYRQYPCVEVQLVPSSPVEWLIMLPVMLLFVVSIIVRVAVMSMFWVFSFGRVTFSVDDL